MDRKEIDAGLARLERQFMTPSIWRGDAWEVSYDHGSTAIVDADVAGIGKDGTAPDNLQDYVEGKIDTDAEGNPVATLRRGVWLAQLSAAGYLDQTDLSVHTTEAEAEAYLVETYDDDSE